MEPKTPETHFDDSACIFKVSFPLSALLSLGLLIEVKYESNEKGKETPWIEYILSLVPRVLFGLPYSLWSLGYRGSSFSKPTLAGCGIVTFLLLCLLILERNGCSPHTRGWNLNEISKETKRNFIMGKETNNKRKLKDSNIIKRQEWVSGEWG